MALLLTKSSSNIKKIKSYSHGEFNDSKLTVENIEKRITKSEDIFNRGFKLKKIDLDGDYPEYILKNKEKFLKWTIKVGAPDRVEPITSGAETGAYPVEATGA